MMWRIAAAGLLSAVVGVVLSEMGFKGKRIFAAVCFTLLITAAFGESSEMFGKIIGFADGAGTFPRLRGTHFVSNRRKRSPQANFFGAT